MRVLYVDDIPTPYRLGVFRQFRERFDGLFALAFCAEAEPGRKWDFDLGEIGATVMDGRQWRPARQRNPMSVKWNPGINRLIRQVDPDVTVLSGYMHPTMQVAARTLRRMGRPYGLACESSFLQSSPTGLRWRLKRLLLGPFVRGIRFGLPCGSQAERYLRALGAETQPMYAFPNTPDATAIARDVDASDASGATDRLLASQGLDASERLVLFVGRMIDAKRPMDAIEAFRRVDPATRSGVRLVFVGDGPLRDDLEVAASTSGLPCAFTGWLAPDEVHPLMGAATVMVLPSGHEPWGAVVNECMAAGTPVIASDHVGAAHDLIEHRRNGWRFEAGDVGALARWLEDALAAQGAADEAGVRARATACAQGAEFAAGNLLAAVHEAVT